MDEGFYYRVKKRFCVTDLNEYPVTHILLARRPIFIQNKDKYAHDR